VGEGKETHGKREGIVEDPQEKETSVGITSPSPNEVESHSFKRGGGRASICGRYQVAEGIGTLQGRDEFRRRVVETALSGGKRRQAGKQGK